MMEEEKGLGEIIKSARKACGFTLKDLEKASGISFSQLSKIERGVNIPSRPNAERLADALNIDKRTLLLAAGFVDEDSQKTAKKAVAVGAVAGAMLGAIGLPFIGSIISAAGAAAHGIKSAVKDSNLFVTVHANSNGNTAVTEDKVAYKTFDPLKFTDAELLILRADVEEAYLKSVAKIMEMRKKCSDRDEMEDAE